MSDINITTDILTHPMTKCCTEYVQEDLVDRYQELARLSKNEILEGPVLELVEEWLDEEYGGSEEDLFGIFSELPLIPSIHSETTTLQDAVRNTVLVHLVHAALYVDEIEGPTGFLQQILNDYLQDEIIERFIREEAPHANLWSLISSGGPGFDQTAANEAFNNWTDSLNKSGEIGDWVYDMIVFADFEDLPSEQRYLLSETMLRHGED